MRRVILVHGPTPLVTRPRLSEMLGVDLWIKRDDATAGAESGNKVRKLEYLLADALARGAKTVVTCGGIQSNHARATALACAQLGLRCVLLLRVNDGPTSTDEPAPRGLLPRAGNVLLDRMAGAEIRLVSKEDYAQRSAVMETVALRLGGAYVIPEGGSNGLGALGYVEAMREVRMQLDLGLGPGRFDTIVHACGSGGTAVGVALGASHHEVSPVVRAIAVCDDRAYFERVCQRIAVEARGHDPDLPAEMPLVIDDAGKGPAYAVTTEDQRRFLVEVTRASGLVLDPVYTGKALYGLKLAIERGDIARGARVLFIHTGGLPGLLAQAEAMEDAL
jgi:D-cysteine desulfhydrase